MLLKSDQKAVLNLASWPINNEITETFVNEIKQIKGDMYDRASLELLKKKVMYESFYS